MLSLASLSLLATAASAAVGGARRFIDADGEASLRAASAELAPSYPAYNLSIPIDHFQNSSQYEPHSDGTFNNRYWFDASHYKPGGPVILFVAGEASGDYRFPLLEKGIVYQLASAHGGIGVILEHRFYGTSFPFEDITVEDARFLTTEQSLADAAYFAKNVVFPGLENENLTSSGTPWIVYGVSYSGGQSAFLRKLYPDVFWGGISSSGVTEAIIDYWRYFEPVRQYGPADCIWTQQFITDVVDKVFIDSKNETLKGQFKLFFNYATTALDQNFVNNLYEGLYSWQSRNWDPTIGSGTFSNWCRLITSSKLEYPSTAAANASAASILEATGYGGNDTLTLRLLNYAGYLNRFSLADAGPLDGSASASSSASLATAVPAEQFDSWGYQTCTEWGYWVTGSGFDLSLGKPLLSRILDLEYENSYCESEFGIVTPPNITAINKYGGFDISYPRLAIINGLADVWREATPAADAARPRESTISEPWIVIDDPPEDVWDGLRGAGHHWEANGVFANQTQKQQPPTAIAEAQADIVQFVGTWIEEWRNAKRG
ncbi:hypothetical protein J7T55_014656 [Diaporthe amygdali]|uniref:uncharacterized protein n=1 Tax=Phomopsis amygdali TaxID=1214568 RepID=UPI0022FEB2FA|nr:uncharacterized protein J7T55_014656 [Diaporthe amygdali]KAJ0107126.1 hypothetical protein J7T55_014656 [Diaporthe amygdali]